MIIRVYKNLFENEDGWRLVLWFSVIMNVNLALLKRVPLGGRTPAESYLDHGKIIDAALRTGMKEGWSAGFERLDALERQVELAQRPRHEVRDRLDLRLLRHRWWWRATKDDVGLRPGQQVDPFLFELHAHGQPGGR